VFNEILSTVETGLSNRKVNCAAKGHWTKVLSTALCSLVTRQLTSISVTFKSLTVINDFLKELVKPVKYIMLLAVTMIVQRVYIACCNLTTLFNYVIKLLEAHTVNE